MNVALRSSLFHARHPYIPRHIAFIIGLRSLQNRPTEFTWSRYTAVSTETGWEPSESMNI